MDGCLAIYTMEKDTYVVYGPVQGKKWARKCVDCWWCLKPNSVTQKNRCYIPIRVQDRIDGSFLTPQEVEDKMTQKWGYFHTWQCALAYCKVHFPHLCFKVHNHAKRNGFVGILAATTDPRFTMAKFNPYVSKKKSQTFTDLVPDPKIGMFMRRVPPIEQCTMKFPDANIVLEKSSEEPVFSKDFPQCVQDSEQLVDQLGAEESKPKPTKPINPTNPTKPTKRKRKEVTKSKQKPKKRIAKQEIAPLEKAARTQPRLEDFF